MIPLREMRAARRDNAVYALLAKRLRSPSQVAMLVVATTVAAGACWIVYPFVPTGADGLLIWFCIRWGVGELLWTWMAADHSFSEYRRAHNSGQLREWVLTRLPMRDIAAGFAYAGAASLVGAIVVWAMADLLVFAAFGGVERGRSAIVLFVLFEVLAACSHVQTSFWTTWRCLAVAGGYGATLTRWATTMFGLAVWHLGILFFYPFVFMAIRAFDILVTFERDYRTGPSMSTTKATVLLWICVLIVSVPAKALLWQRARHDAEKWFHCFIEKSVES